MVDIYVYLMGLNTSARSKLCSDFQNFTVPDKPGSLQISSITTETFGKLFIIPVILQP